MLLKSAGNWIKEKLKSLRSKSKEKAPPAPKPRYRVVHPTWQRNLLHPTANAIYRGRTLNPFAVMRATQWRINRVKELTAKVKNRRITPKELRELRHLAQ